MQHCSEFVKVVPLQVVNACLTLVCKHSHLGEYDRDRLLPYRREGGLGERDPSLRRPGRGGGEGEWPRWRGGTAEKVA